MGMIRKQFFIDRDVSRRLKQAADERGVSEAQLIREGIEHVVANAEGASRDWRAAFRAAVESITPGTFDDLPERVAENRQRRANTSTARRARNWARREER